MVIICSRKMETAGSDSFASYSHIRLCKIYRKKGTYSRSLGLHISIDDSLYYITSVNPGSPAEEAGLKVNDRILGVSGFLGERLFSAKEGDIKGLVERMEKEFFDQDKLVLLVVNAEALRNSIISDQSFKSDISALQESSQFSDVTVVSDSGRKWHLHRCILGARSPVFAAMFSSDFLEKRSGEVSIIGAQDAELDLMIRHIYGSLDLTQVSGMEKELLSLTNQYQVLNLKKTCEMLLTDSTKDENAFELFLLAEKHNAPSLRESAKQRVSKNLKSICSTDEWMTLLQEDPKVANEIISCALQKQVLQ